MLSRAPAVPISGHAWAECVHGRTFYRSLAPTMLVRSNIFTPFASERFFNGPIGGTCCAASRKALLQRLPDRRQRTVPTRKNRSWWRRSSLLPLCLPKPSACDGHPAIGRCACTAWGSCPAPCGRRFEARARSVRQPGTAVTRAHACPGARARTTLPARLLLFDATPGQPDPSEWAGAASCPLPYIPQTGKGIV